MSSRQSSRRDSPRRQSSSPRGPPRSPSRGAYSPRGFSRGPYSPRGYGGRYSPRGYPYAYGGSSFGAGVAGGLVGGLVGGALGTAIGGYGGYYGGYPSYYSPRYYSSSYPTYYEPPVVVTQPTYITSPALSIPYTVVNNGRSLAEKVGSLGPGQVLDVSHIDIYGNGSRIIPAVTSLRNHKRGIPGLPVVSNNSRTYIQALEEIYGPDVWITHGSQLQQLRATYPNW